MPAAAVTPAGVRNGDPEALAGLCERRGPAVLAYCEHVVSDGRAAIAAAEAFRRFRVAVVEAGDLAELDPEALLISATRHAAAEHVPTPPQPPDVLRGVARRPATGWCGDVPALLAARAERTITRIDLARLEQHLAGCPACRAPEARFQAAERAYRNPPATPMALPATAAIIAALATAAPIRGEDLQPALSMHGAAPIAPPEPAAAEPEPALPEPEPDPEPELPAAVEASEQSPTEVHALEPEPEPMPTPAPQPVHAAPAVPSSPHESQDSGRTQEYRIPDFVDPAGSNDPVEPVSSQRDRRPRPSLPSVSLPSLSLPSLSLPSISLPKLRSRRARQPPATHLQTAPSATAGSARASSSRSPIERLSPVTLLPAVLVLLAIIVAMAVAGVFGGGGDPESPASSTPTPAAPSGGGKTPDVIVVPGGAASAAAVEAAKARARARAKREAERDSGSSGSPQSSAPTDSNKPAASPTPDATPPPPPPPPPPPAAAPQVNGGAGATGNERPAQDTSEVPGLAPAP